MRSMAISWLAPFIGGLVIAGGLASAQQAQHPAPTLLELYTSQGCSSCPPADKLIQSYAKRRDIVALSFNVDYWDYLGWKDTLARREYSKRQRTYAMKRGDGEVYTPQIVVNGVTHAVGSMRRRVDRAISIANDGRGKQNVPLTVTHKNGKLTVSVGGQQPVAIPRSATVWLATVRSKVTVPVKRGENHGRTLTYYNVVDRLTPIGMWSGKQTVIELKDEDVLQGKADNCAVLVQLGKGGPIVAARWMTSAS
ncbi:MAG: DUF1223 domain-containing protein [Pseudomonadota bacterium]